MKEEQQKEISEKDIQLHKNFLEDQSKVNSNEKRAEHFKELLNLYFEKKITHEQFMKTIGELYR